MRIDPGQELSLLHWALLSLREKFADEAADALAEQDALEYVSNMESIERIDLLLDEMFFQLNKVYGRLMDIEVRPLARHKEEVDTERRNSKVAALNEKYGWK